MKTPTARSLVSCLRAIGVLAAAACGGGTNNPAQVGAGLPLDGGPSNGSAAASGNGSPSAPKATPDPNAPSGGPVTDAGGQGAPAGDAAAASTRRKRGLAYGENTDADLAALSPGIGWWYNWSPKPDKTLGSSSASHADVEFVPMVWGGKFDVATLAQQVPTDAEFLLTFNEPNFGAQSNLTPSQAAALWPQIEAFAKSRNMKIVSPAVNYCGGACNETNPFTWLEKFFTACVGCQVDYVAMHWYACSKAALVSTLAQYEKQFQKPLWLTEFSCLDTAADVTDAYELAYLQDAVSVLEADPMVFRYAWFTGRSQGSPPISLLSASPGKLTPLGEKYVALPASP